MKKTLNWHDINWLEANRKIRGLQSDLISMRKDNNMGMVYKIQRKIVTSFEGRALAVRRVTTSQGGKTPGVDGRVLNTPEKRMEAIETLGEIVQHPNTYKAKPLLRVWIPKPNSTEERPLGIPTIMDRALQAVYHSAVDPLVEMRSDPNSFGFRRGRSTHDAMARIRTILDKKVSPEWCLDADISKCFDKISHEYLLANTPMVDMNILQEWLESGVFHLTTGEMEPTIAGTPQGGVISPMLCNVALNGLEGTVRERISSNINKRKGMKVHVVRYADDFIITGLTEALLNDKVKPLVGEFLEHRGLKLHPEKTSIRNIRDGFEFLGFEIRRYPWNHKLNKGQGEKQQETILVIKPAKKNVHKMRDRIRTIIKSPGKPLNAVVKEINPVLRGWAEYFRISYHSAKIFQSIGHYVWKKLWTWLRKKHPNRTAKWVFQKYVHPNLKRTWRFGPSPEEIVFDISTVTTIWYPPMKMDADNNPYTNPEYFEKRRNYITLAKFRKTIYEKFEYKCAHCGESLLNHEPIELHHKIPGRLGGKWSLTNIIPLHRVCHQAITARPKEDTN